MTTEQLAALKEVAEKATRGPWRAVALLADAENHHVLAGEFSDRHVKASAEDNNGLVAFADLPANTEFIAAFDPTRCLELLEEVILLRAITAGLTDVINGQTTPLEEVRKRLGIKKKDGLP